MLPTFPLSGPWEFVFKAPSKHTATFAPVTDEHYMLRCFDLARRGLGRTATNPIVGAVLVHNDRIIGEGWHKQWGGPHAEVDCLQSVRDEARLLIPNSTLYVSLEPCAHWGKQPPCAQKIIEAGIRKVVASVDDPNPQVGGRGYRILEEAGVKMVRGILAAEGRWMVRRFLSLHEQSRPYIILKWAQSADGFIAPPDGTRTQLSGPISQRLVHKWRTEEGAILVGYRTALADNPRLTARLWDGQQPLRIGLDRNATLPRTHHLFGGDAPTWLVSEVEAQDLPAHVHTLRSLFDVSLFPTLFNELKAANVSSIIIEGGTATINSALGAGLWDEARIFHTPVSLGDGLPAPQLQHAVAAFSVRTGDDELQVFTRAGGRCVYPQCTVL